VRACVAARPWVDRNLLAKGFDQLVVSPEMYDKLGPAVNSGKSLFLYGAPGNGKTVVAEGIGRALGTEMYVPHAIDVDGQTITMFDPVSHVAAATPGASQSVIAASVYDRRWTQIRRPVVVVGGELTLEMLDLTFNPIARFYRRRSDEGERRRVRRRRLQPAARPAARPPNRWIVPLEAVSRLPDAPYGA
jgi:hypothetical protein